MWRVANAAICLLTVIAFGGGAAWAQGPNSPIIHTTRNHVFPQTYVIDDLPLRRTIVSMIPPPTGTPENPCGRYMSVSGSSRGVGGGVIMLTPTGGVDFAPYLRRTLDSVRKNWYASMPADASAGTKGCVVLNFTILRTGRLSGVGALVLLQSGDRNLDDACVNAVNSSAPFSSLPDDFKGNFIVLRFTFLYNIGNFPNTPSTVPNVIPNAVPKPKVYLDTPQNGNSHK
jgi:TonB C terminal